LRPQLNGGADGGERQQDAQHVHHSSGPVAAHVVDGPGFSNLHITSFTILSCACLQ
jgi:hypothetical protein